MRKKLKGFYITFCAGLLLIYALSVQVKYWFLEDDYRHLQDKYLQQALTYVGHIYARNLNKYKTDNGRYPDSLDALFPNYVSRGNLSNAYSSQLVLEEKYIMKDLTPEEKAQVKQLQAPKCSLWEDWGYTPDQNDNTFKLYVIYEDSDSRNTLEYSPELNDFFVTVSVTVFD